MLCKDPFILVNYTLNMKENVYTCECEGCGDYVYIYIDGFIGVLEGIWCDRCGYEGENMEDVEEED